MILTLLLFGLGVGMIGLGILNVILFLIKMRYGNVDWIYLLVGLPLATGGLKLTFLSSSQVVSFLLYGTLGVLGLLLLFSLLFTLYEHLSAPKKK